MNAIAKLEGWRGELDKMAPEWRALFPTQHHLERFRRVVATAVAGTPALLEADRRTLWGAATIAAQDGLMPDGREGAMVIYNAKVKVKNEKGGESEQWIKTVRWMPMVAGILKKVRASGLILDIAVRVVRDLDKFEYRLGDDERINHVPELEEDPGALRFVYSIVRTKDGGIYREVMSKKQIDKVRKASKTSASGPWADWYEEMACKTVLRKQSKILPMGSEIEAMFQREEEQSTLPEIVMAAPVTSLPRPSSAQAKRDGTFERLSAEIDACADLDALEQWWAMSESEIDGLPNEHWAIAVRDRYEARQEALQKAADETHGAKKSPPARAAEPSEDDFPGDRP